MKFFSKQLTKENFSSSKPYLLLVYSFLLLIFLFHFVSNLVWLHLDVFPFGADELGHLENGMTISKILKNPLNFFRVETIFPHKWGPLYYLISALLILFFGYSHFTFMMTSSIFFILLLSLVFFIGKKLKDELTGLLAVLILSMYPIVFHFSRKYSYEIAIMVTVAFSILCLLKIDNFENRKYSLLFFENGARSLQTFRNRKRKHGTV